MKKIFLLLKRIVLAISFIYAFDLVARGLLLFIPINLVTVGVVSSLGISGMLALIAMFYIL